MPRLPAFDNDHVLDQAMYAFWRRGYHATSIRDLIKATGLQPGSLYAAFGGKRQLFQCVLDHYHQYNIDRIRAHLNTDAPPLERIRLVFDRLVKRCLEDMEARGCLMSNTILELSCVDTELSRRANDMFDEIEQALIPVIREGQEQGQIPRDKQASGLARYLVSNIHGIRVYSRNSPESSHLRGLVDKILDSISVPAAP